MSARPTVVVLGTSLASEYHALWQRQQEFTTCLMGLGNVLYVERAAGGLITPARVAGRVRKLLRPHVASDACASFPASPVFVRWTQVPFSGTAAWRASARNAKTAITRACERLGWQPPSFAVCGTPTEVWRYLLEVLDVPFWYDLWERVLESRLFATTDRDAMAWIARSAALMTADTEIGAGDWRAVRADIVVVPHGAREWGALPSFDSRREDLYYVGSLHGAFDRPLVRQIAARTGRPVRVIGPGVAGELGEAVRMEGWRAAGDIPAALSDAAAGLVPYVVDAFGEGIYPTKVYEYLLAGAPVLSTPLPALAGMPYVETCTTADEFAEAFDRARECAAEERRAMRAYALENGWSRRFEVVRELLAPVAPELFGREASR